MSLFLQHRNSMSLGFRVLVVCFAQLLSLPVFAGGGVDKSGVKPQVLKLPTGPGSIDGLGESFEAQINSGTASYRVPLEVPPGRAGFQPNITLNYNGGNGNSTLGIGWTLSLPSIQRRTDKGLPVYADKLDIFVAGGEELIEVSPDIYRVENEGVFQRFLRQGDNWLVQHRDGSTTYYDASSAGAVSDGDHIFRWYPSRRVDVNGNEILYRYNESNGFGNGQAPTDGSAYLTSITYNENELKTHRAKVTLHYQQRSSYDSLFSYRSRYPIQLTQRVGEIRTWVSGQPVKVYKLIYDPKSVLSRLGAVEVYGRDLSQGPLPSILRFEYSEFALNSMIIPMDQGINPGVGLFSPDVDLVDMNGDALPDLLHTGDVHRAYLNDDGKTWRHSYDVPGGFSTIKLQQSNTMLMDMDADGYSDLFQHSQQDAGSSIYRYFRGGHTTGGWELLPIVMANSPTFTFSAITRPVDLDNDGRTDVLFKPDLSTAIGCIFNKQGQAFSGVLSVDSPTTFNLGEETTGTVRLADMNGDGLQDFVVLKAGGELWYFPGRGVTMNADTPRSYQGWDPTPRNWPVDIANGEGYWMNDAPDSLDDDDFADAVKYRALRLLDINGDGLSDLVYVANNRLKAWLNLGGHGFSPNAYTVTQNIPGLNAETHIRNADMNGNGTTDIVWNRQQAFSELGESATWVYLDLTAGVRPNLITRIHNGTGQITTVTYKSAVEDLVADRKANRNWKYKVPFPVNVIDRIDVFDGIGATYSQRFMYHDGYFDPTEKEFRGFAEVEKIELGDASSPTLVSRFQYDTGATTEALKGKPLQMQAEDDGGKAFFRESYTWQSKELFYDANTKRAVTYASQTQKQRVVLEQGGGNPVRLQWDYLYDDFGNQVKVTEYGRLDAGWDDERITVFRYSADCPKGQALWILDRLIEQRVTDESGKQASHKENYYDKETTLCELSKGNLTRQKNWVAGSEYIDTVRNDYDNHGNIVAVYDPLFGKQPGHYREIEYDDYYSVFPVVEKIYTGKRRLQISVGYDFPLGKVSSSTDFNGHVTDYRYDTFGRLSTIVKPGDSLQNPTEEFDYTLNHQLPSGQVINWVETRKREVSGQNGTLDARTFYDGLGRTIMTRSEGETTDQIVVSDTVEFNARKQPWKKYLPYFETGTLDFVDPTYNTGFIKHQYDALGRMTRMTQPDGSYSAIEYAPLARTVRDEEQTNPNSKHRGAAMSYVEDGLQDNYGKGRLREVFEVVKLTDLGEASAKPVAWKTTYRYNLLDNFTGYTDSQNNQKLIEYDGLGRKTFMNDPDRGHMHYRYDEAGNLERTIDAKLQTIRYQYDGVNRLEKEFYSAGLPTPDVVYHYDAPKGPLGRGNYWGQASRIARVILDSSSTKLPHDLNADGIDDVADVVTVAKTDQADNVTANNTLGKLAWVEDQSGQEHLSYDNRGRVEWKIKRINDRQSITHAFYSANRYDAMDRVTRYTYPDGSYVNYQYNNRGLLESVPGVIDRCDYNEAGQNVLLALSNGVTTFYSYDGRLRLQRLQSKRGSDILILQDLNYKYDNVSNITTITDERDAATLNAIGDELGIENLEAQKFNATQAFEYDDLYRLTKSANGSIYGHIEYRYDRIGNLVRVDAANLLVPKPALNLGEVSNGGVAGAWNRNGRDVSDPPGPHALTGAENNSFGGGVFSYDSNGNMINYGGINLDWDYLDRLITVNNFNSKAEYRYDYLGKRKLKTLVNLDDIGKVVVYVDRYSEIRNGRLHKYVYSGSKRVAEKRGLRPNGRTWLYAYYLHDHLGSANLLLSAGGVIEEYFESYSYGHMRKEVVNSSGDSDTRYKYTGKEYDEESGYMYFGDRYYSSNIGAFISVDKAYTSDLVGDEGGYGYLVNPQILSTYRYAVNNPTLNVDNDGRSAAVAGAVVGAIVGGTAGTLVSGASELLTQQGSTDWSAVRAAAYKGAVGGAVAGGITAAAVGAALTLGGSLALDAAVIGTVAGGAGGFSGKLFENLRDNLKSDKALFQGIASGTLSATLGGAAGGAIAGPVGQRISTGLANRFGKNSFKQLKSILPNYGQIGFFEKVVGAPKVGPAFTGAGAVGGTAAGEATERGLKRASERLASP